MSKAKVLIVDDSPLVRRIVNDKLNGHPGIEVVGTAANAHIAEIKMRQLNPDVITLDIEMPGMNGLEFLERVMQRDPKPVIMMSVLTQNGAMATFEALDKGAFDFVPKPSSVMHLTEEEVGRQLITKILAAKSSQYVNKFKLWEQAGKPAGLFSTETLKQRNMASTVVFSKTQDFFINEKKSGIIDGPPVETGKAKEMDFLLLPHREEILKRKIDSLTVPKKQYQTVIDIWPSHQKTQVKYVLLGTSTGGPNALAKIVKMIPANFPASLLIVQHMPPGFTKAFAMRLNSLARINIKEAEDGEIIIPGQGYVAAGDYHLIVEEKGAKSYIRLEKSAPVNGHRPSIDVLFNSVAYSKRQSDVIAVIMTGMGKDGAKGIRNLRQKGAFTIAQDENSSAVFGMNREAIMIDGIEAVAHLEQIIPMIVTKL